MDDGGRRSCNGSRRDSTCGSFGAGGSVDPVSGTTLLHTAALEIRFGRNRLPIDRVCRCVPRIEPVRLGRASKRSAADGPSAGGTLPGHIDGRSASIRTDEATLLICSLRVGGFGCCRPCQAHPRCGQVSPDDSRQHGVGSVPFQRVHCRQDSIDRLDGAATAGAPRPRLRVTTRRGLLDTPRARGATFTAAAWDHPASDVLRGLFCRRFCS